MQRIKTVKIDVQALPAPAHHSPSECAAFECPPFEHALLDCAIVIPVNPQPTYPL